MFSVFSFGILTQIETNSTIGFVISFIPSMAVFVQALAFDSVGIHGIRKLEYFELREQVFITPEWRMTCVVFLIGM